MNWLKTFLYLFKKKVISIFLTLVATKKVGQLINFPLIFYCWIRDLEWIKINDRDKLIGSATLGSEETAPWSPLS
jgi:hypothetical protein